MKISAAAPWLFTLAAVGFFAVSISPGIDEVTAPGTFARHMLLRKTYSVLAFSVLGYLLAWSHKRTSTVSLVLSAVAIGAFSLLIEYFQYITGAHEGRIWNAADVLMGLFGGMLGALFYARPRR
ncbi:MAG: VanZ family protein [Candidatus Eremiobacteraeota bacterium]|nr:VanZ family protein [Candidatus Eremiobacteraeota bacterium]